MIFWLEKIIDIALIGLNERSRILKITNESKFLIPFVDRVLNKSLMSLQIQNKLAESNLPIDQFLINE